MIKKDKDLLLMDLSGRVTYRPICHSICGDFKLLGVDEGMVHLDAPVYEPGDDYFDLEYMEVKPYLRSISSMTKEECMEWREYMTDIEDSCYELINERISIMQDWLNAHQFDYRGLIPKGLALEAPEGMYNLNK